MDVCANTSGVYISKRGDQVATNQKMVEMVER
jgi:hypothetical protein